MVQTQSTGRRANRWGRDTARLIADEIGAKMVSPTSNAAMFRDKRVVIKCLGPRTQYVRITLKMLSTIKLVIAAVQLPDGSFDLRSLSVDLFRKSMHYSTSKSHTLQKVGQVSRSIFRRHGRLVGTVRL
jgi:hypothetical protein